MRHIRWMVLLAILPSLTASANEELWKGLPPGPGREAVFHTCSICHSLMIVQQQGLSYESWQETLEWMVEEQGMAPLDEAEQTLILNYLATHYGNRKKQHE